MTITEMTTNHHHHHQKHHYLPHHWHDSHNCHSFMLSFELHEAFVLVNGTSQSWQIDPTKRECKKGTRRQKTLTVEGVRFVIANVSSQDMNESGPWKELKGDDDWNHDWIWYDSLFWSMNRYKRCLAKRQKALQSVL